MGQAQGALNKNKSGRKNGSVSAKQGAEDKTSALGAYQTSRDLESEAYVPSRLSASSGAPSTPSIRESGLHAGRKSMSLSRFAGSQDGKYSDFSGGNVTRSNRGSSDWLQNFEGRASTHHPGGKARSRQQSFESWVSNSDRTYHDASQTSHTPHASDAPKRSFDSAGSSCRSSFARERPSFEQPFVEAVSQQQELSGLVADTLSSLAEELHYMYLSLAVLQPDAPVPLSAMQLIWDEPQFEAACSIAEYLKHHGVLRIATLEDASLWCLVEKEHLVQLQAACEDHRAQLHASLLSAYTRNGQLPWEVVPDDGYILQHLAHHMLAAGQLDELRSLLLNPSWLQLKLQEYGVSGVVLDMRRYIQTQDSPVVKLVLLALQASVGACTSHMAVSLLRTQLVARLTRAAQHLPELKAWHQEQLQHCVSDAVLNSAEGKILALLPATPSLAQTGGRQRLQLRHQTGAVVTVVVLMRSGTELITASDDGTLMVWEVDTGECTKQMRVTNSAITAMGVTPDGQWCIVGSAAGQMAIWNLKTDQLAHRPKGHIDRINAVVVESSGWRVASTSSDGTARVWGIETAECQFVLSGHGCNTGGAGVSPAVGVVWDCAFSSDSTLLGTVSDDFTARIWDATSGECLHVLEGHSGWVVGCVFVPGTHTFISASHDGTARVWDAKDAALKHVLKGHTGRVTRVRAVKQDQLIITASDDYSVCTWDTNTGRCLSRVEGHSAWTDSETSTSSPPVLATTGEDYSLAVWDPYEGTLLDTLSGHTGVIMDACFSHKGRFVITASEDSTVRVWDLNAPGDGEQVKHDGKVKGLCLVQGGKSVASIGDDCVLRIWDMETGACSNSWTGHRTGLNWVLPCSSGRRVITASADRKVCSLDLEQGELSVALPAQQGSRVKSIALDARARMAAVALYDSTVTLWWLDLGDGEQEREVEGGKERTMQQLIRKGDLNGASSHSGGINAVYVSLDGKTVLTVSKDTTCRVWDVATLTCRLVLEGHEDSVNCAALSPDSQYVATASYDKTTRYWSLEDGRCLCVLKHSAPVSSLCISPDGNMLGCVADDNIVTLGRLPSGQQTAWLTKHTATVNGVIFTPDSAHAITFADDCTLQVWDAQTGKLVALFVADDAVCAAVAHQGMIVAGDAGGEVHFLPFPPWEHCYLSPTDVGQQGQGGVQEWVGQCLVSGQGTEGENARADVPENWACCPGQDEYRTWL